MEKRQKIREKRHEAYLRRKSTGWQATYYWKNKRARKEKMDAAKEASSSASQLPVPCCSSPPYCCWMSRSLLWTPKSASRCAKS